MRQTESACNVAARGIVLPLVAIVIVVLVGFLALAIDLGMLAIAKTQVQQSADLAALTAMRTLNGNASISYNQSAATTNAQNVVTYNVILGQPLSRHNSSSPSARTTTTRPPRRFRPISRPPAVRRRRRSRRPSPRISLPGAFSSILKTQFLPTVTATAQAVHRPRDIALVLDLSGSMRFGTCLGFDFYTSSRTSNNPDTVYPDIRPLLV